MSILSGYKKIKRYIKQSTGYQVISQWTNAESVEFNDGTILEDKRKEWDNFADSSVTGVKGDAETAYRTGNVNITPMNIGLGNVGNFKAISTVASQGLTDTEKTNARSNIGAAPTSHASTATTYGVSTAANYGHAMASSTTPKANGTATVGTETAKFARGDHVHPLQTTVSGSSGSCTGNAATATKLETARTLRTNLASTATANFDGSANITPGVTGILPVANGGTGKATLTANQVLVGNGTSAVSQRAIDTAVGGTSGSTSLITSGAVYSGRAQIAGYQKYSETSTVSISLDTSYKYLLFGSANGTSMDTLDYCAMMYEYSGSKWTVTTVSSYSMPASLSGNTLNIPPKTVSYGCSGCVLLKFK